MPAETGWSMSHRLASSRSRHRALMASLITSAPVGCPFAREAGRPPTGALRVTIKPGRRTWCRFVAGHPSQDVPLM